MKIKIYPERDKPIFEQIIDSIKYAIGVGVLKPCEKLPSIRNLATELGINRNTVLKAYDILEREGYSTTKRGMGSYVSKNPPQLSMEERKEIISNELNKMLLDAYYLQIPLMQLNELLSLQIKKFVIEMGRRESN